jgi:hypothetical protein
MENISYPLSPSHLCVVRQLSVKCLLVFLIVIVFLLPVVTKAQDPVLPPANLGLTNMNDGFVPGPGLYFFNYVQVYKSRSLRDGEGNKLPTSLRLKSFGSVFQVAWLTRISVAGGNLGFTALLPVVKISTEDPGGIPPTVNTGALGDLTVGPAIQWLNRKMFDKPLFHRLELTTTFPTGSYDKRFIINTSSHLYTFTLNHALTWYFANKWSVSTRNHISYNTRTLGSSARPGIFYNVNYSLEKVIAKNLNVEAVGYYLRQIEQDSFAGDHSYYQDRFGVKDTREEVLAIGPGVSWLAPAGLFMEGKVLFETGAKNRFRGIRPTLRLIYQLTK